MQQEVAKGVDYFIPQGLRNSEHPTIDGRPYRSRRYGFDVANIATDPPEELFTFQGCGRRSKHCVARWNHCAAYELSKMVDVSQTKVIWLIFRVRRSLEHCRNVLGAQAVRDAHLVEIGVADKGEQAAVLVLPAEASDASLSGSLENRSLYHFTMNSTVSQFGLFRGDCNQSPILYGFYKSIAQGVEGSA